MLLPKAGPVLSGNAALGPLVFPCSVSVWKPSLPPAHRAPSQDVREGEWAAFGTAQSKCSVENEQLLWTALWPKTVQTHTPIYISTKSVCTQIATSVCSPPSLLQVVTSLVTDVQGPSWKARTTLEQTIRIDSQNRSTTKELILSRWFYQSKRYSRTTGISSSVQAVVVECITALPLLFVFSSSCSC